MEAKTSAKNAKGFDFGGALTQLGVLLVPASLIALFCLGVWRSGETKPATSNGVRNIAPANTKSIPASPTTQCGAWNDFSGAGMIPAATATMRMPIVATASPMNSCWFGLAGVAGRCLDIAMAQPVV